MDAWVMFREGRKEEAGWILRKYEKTRLYQQKQVTVRAVFFYVNSYVGGNCLPQLQKLLSETAGELDPGAHAVGKRSKTSAGFPHGL